MSVRVPNDQEKIIMRRHGMSVGQYGVIHSNKDTLVLLHYKSGETLIIRGINH